ncbi:hypothetical protein D918_04517 [Trichuris suis]|nr:hypothetical protein D918_04517 [Trichuris suis]
MASEDSNKFLRNYSRFFSSANEQLYNTVKLHLLSNRRRNCATFNEDRLKTNQTVASKICSEHSGSNFRDSKNRVMMDCRDENAATANSRLTNSSVTRLFETVAFTNNFTIPEELLSQIDERKVENDLHINTMSRIILLFVNNGNITKRNGDLARKFLALKANMRGNKLPFWEFKHAICHFARI